jgi:hypothetical protein
MSTARANSVYYQLVIVATSAATERWLGDDAGHLVSKEVGALRTRLRPGDCVVEFGLGRAAYPIPLVQARRYTQTELQAGNTCARPMPPLPPAEGSATVGRNASGALVMGTPARPISGVSRRGGPRGSPPAFGPAKSSTQGEHT